MDSRVHLHRALQIAQHGGIADPLTVAIFLHGGPEVALIGCDARDCLQVVELLAQNPDKLRRERHLEIILNP